MQARVSGGQLPVVSALSGARGALGGGAAPRPMTIETGTADGLELVGAESP